LLLQRQDPYSATGGIPDPEVYDFLRRSVALTQQSTTASPTASAPNHPFRSSSFGGGYATSNVGGGQFHLLYKHQQQSGSIPNFKSSSSSPPLASTKQSPFASSVVIPPKRYPTRLVVRRHPVRSAMEEGLSGTHIYAVRWTESINKHGGPLRGRMEPLHRQEQYPTKKKKSTTHRLLSPPVSHAISSTASVSPTSPATKSTVSRSSMANLTISASDDCDDSGFDIIAPTSSQIRIVSDNQHLVSSGLIGTSSGACSDGNRQLEDRRATPTTTNYNTVTTGIALTIAPDGGVVVDDALASVSSASSDASLSSSSGNSSGSGSSTLSVDHLFRPAAMAAPPKRKGTLGYCCAIRPFRT
jgi:hypothetical protein